MKNLLVIGIAACLLSAIDCAAQTGQPVSATREVNLEPATAVNDSTQAAGTTMDAGKSGTSASKSAEPVPAQGNNTSGAQPADDKKRPRQ